MRAIDVLRDVVFVEPSPSEPWHMLGAAKTTRVLCSGVDPTGWICRSYDDATAGGHAVCPECFRLATAQPELVLRWRPPDGAQPLT